MKGRGWTDNVVGGGWQAAKKSTDGRTDATESSMMMMAGKERTNER